MEFDIPMTLTVEAETVEEAHVLAMHFERERERFPDDGLLRWLHVGTSPEAATHTEHLRLIAEMGRRSRLSDGEEEEVDE